MTRPHLSCQTGIYVVDFPAIAAVKVGRTGNLRSRIRKHVKDGATQAHAWVLTDNSIRGYLSASTELNGVEFGALCTVRREGEQIRATERVRGVPFTRACELVDDHLRQKWAGTVSAHPVQIDELQRIANPLYVPLTRLTEEPKP